MDWKAFLVTYKPLISTFTLLLLAELGDKTQLAVITQTAKFQSPVLVFIGAALALVLVTALGVVLGQLCATCLPEKLIKTIAGSAFVLMGVLMLFGKI